MRTRTLRRMSRHEIEARDPARHRVIVGWDPPLQTYFVHVIDRRREAIDDDRPGRSDKFDLWVGAKWRELYEIDELARHLAPYAELTNLMRAKLYRDKDDNQA